MSVLSWVNPPRSRSQRYGPTKQEFVLGRTVKEVLGEVRSRRPVSGIQVVQEVVHAETRVARVPEVRAELVHVERVPSGCGIGDESSSRVHGAGQAIDPK